MQTNPKRSERDSIKPGRGLERSSGLHVPPSFLNSSSLDHAHPTWVAGHPFKGSWVFSTGQLQHPDLKRFALSTAVFFKPVFPGKNPYDKSVEQRVPSFGDFFLSYFGKVKSVKLCRFKCSQLNFWEMLCLLKQHEEGNVNLVYLNSATCIIRLELL